MLWPKPNFYLYIYIYNKGGPKGSTFVFLIGGVPKRNGSLKLKKQKETLNVTPQQINIKVAINKPANCVSLTLP
jgi:hypothetical protein